MAMQQNLLLNKYPPLLRLAKSHRAQSKLTRSTDIQLEARTRSGSSADASQPVNPTDDPRVPNILTGQGDIVISGQTHLQG